VNACIVKTLFFALTTCGDGAYACGRVFGFIFIVSEFVIGHVEEKVVSLLIGTKAVGTPSQGRVQVVRMAMTNCGQE
jgi:hypothetical protein